MVPAIVIVNITRHLTALSVIKSHLNTLGVNSLRRHDFHSKKKVTDRAAVKLMFALLFYDLPRIGRVLNSELVLKRTFLFYYAEYEFVKARPIGISR